MEKAKIQKSRTTLIDDYFNHPSTSLLIFHFESQLYIATELRLKRCAVEHVSIEGKDLYLFDDFFLSVEGKEMQDFSRTASFSRHSYGSGEAIEKGQQPAYSMNGKERWQFFSNPPAAIQELYKLFGMFANKLNADVTTLPWELVDQEAHGSPSVIANKLEHATIESMEFGKHQDYNPEGEIFFSIPILYKQELEFHPNRFVNGDAGRPWMVSIMVYITEDGFIPEYRMGTAFYRKNGEMATRVECRNMRIVLFEGDIFHSMEESNIPDGIKTWRVSYVFKLIMNPRERDQNIKKSFFELFCVRLGL